MIECLALVPSLIICCATLAASVVGIGQFVSFFPELIDNATPWQTFGLLGATLVGGFSIAGGILFVVSKLLIKRFGGKRVVEFLGMSTLGLIMVIFAVAFVAAAAYLFFVVTMGAWEHYTFPAIEECSGIGPWVDTPHGMRFDENASFECAITTILFVAPVLNLLLPGALVYFVGIVVVDLFNLVGDALNRQLDRELGIQTC